MNELEDIIKLQKEKQALEEAVDNITKPLYKRINDIDELILSKKLDQE